MVVLSSNVRRIYSRHGWSDDDIQYLAANADEVLQHSDWALGIATAPDGVVWIYPASAMDTYPLSLWKAIKGLIESNDNVVIPMSRNVEKVTKAAKRYNGYLANNMFLFGEELAGLQEYLGGKRWLKLQN